jgi:hypothetical protein
MMRTRPSGLRAAAYLVMLGCVAASAAPSEAPLPSSHVLVIFTKPEKFSDVRDGGFPTIDGRDKILASLRDFVTRRAAAYIPAGDAFYINFVDIALAGRLAIGDVENVRVFTRGSPPVFVFGWAITDSKGTVLRKGTERLRENEYMSLLSPALSSDKYRYEKAVLDDWMRNNLGA